MPNERLPVNSPREISGGARLIRLLVVDDRPLYRDGVSEFFRRKAAIGAVRQASDVAEAACQIDSFCPDVALVDLGQNHGSGIETGKALRKHSAELPLVFVDDRIRLARLREILKLRRASYWTHLSTTEDITDAVCGAAGGRTTFCRMIQSEEEMKAAGRSWSFDPVSSEIKRTSLTRREKEVLTILSHGCTVAECARRLGLAASTIDNHKMGLMKKLGVHSTVDLVRLALTEGLVPQ